MSSNVLLCYVVLISFFLWVTYDIYRTLVEGWDAEEEEAAEAFYNEQMKKNKIIELYEALDLYRVGEITINNNVANITLIEYGTKKREVIEYIGLCKHAQSLTEDIIKSNILIKDLEGKPQFYYSYKENYTKKKLTL